jgi:hypothetical protein
MGFSFGSDPEFILSDKKGKFKSAIGVVKGGKEKRLDVGGNFFFYDNVLAECTVEPALSRGQAVENIRKSLKTYAEMVRPFRLNALSSAEFDDSEMSHKDARKAGCEVEMCAYSLSTVSSGRISRFFRKSNLRTAGGHVHIGTEMGKSHDQAVMLTRMLDLLLGVSSLLVDRGAESLARRRLYGLPGRYRQPPHGLEYRTIGNFWLSSPRLVELVYDICARAMVLMEERIYENFWSVDRERLESDEFWNAGGDPSSCHQCHGYDVNLMKEMFSLEFDEMEAKARDILDLVLSLMTPDIRRRMSEVCGRKFDLYKEWGLTF